MQAIGRSVKCACSIMSSQHKALHGYEASKVCMKSPDSMPAPSSAALVDARAVDDDAWADALRSQHHSCQRLQDMAKFPELRRLHA